MKHNSIVAYKVRLEDVRKHLRAKFNDQTIEVEHIGTEFVFYLPVTLTEAEKDEIYDLAP
ncbi:uncharacterized protein FFB20_06266 [Fusarium fujikuroi]|uniref:Uncharacterized protein n=2 Tax=Fusarium fujikuroi species complex TaxID=171627 RepID=A0A1L7VH50_FUSPR|nr:uncharacterized protein FPRO_05732 [Fusarium proliferatum ET1]XP_041678787.1 uncharacterized protein FMAN_05471 [Fusarium mangiferae]CVK87436.1 uncharacterized protein FPRN_05572 [Fusarium proliferatum]SCN80847.1 uncharacterized protein FFB20_06266 [Fusarium fujikuroi]CVK87587.1 uncharacterized protein FMAN_05471 [Fusarium mangiferae]CZR39076.1 uncharacterized protein FPRO_05732 [Fusarium proliferatum ET1]SCN91887.1 uncharacterized protein FFC1_06602 [Fusarium fujikuroi]